MSGKLSAEMKQARELLKTGCRASDAASLSGISKSAISKCAVCKEIIKQIKKTGKTTSF
jgi:predicted transcriptional regulator